MKSTIAAFAILIAVTFLLFSCIGCGSTDVSTNTEVDTNVNAEGGSATIEGSEVSVSGVVIEAPLSMAGLIWNIYSDIFTRIIGCIVLVMWFTGNLHPNKNFSLFDKKE